MRGSRVLVPPDDSWDELAGLAGLLQAQGSYLVEWVAEGWKGGPPEFPFPVTLGLGLGQLPGCVGPHRHPVGPVWAEADQAPTKECKLSGPLWEWNRSARER